MSAAVARIVPQRRRSAQDVCHELRRKELFSRNFTGPASVCGRSNGLFRPHEVTQASPAACRLNLGRVFQQRYIGLCCSGQSRKPTRFDIERNIWYRNARNEKDGAGEHLRLRVLAEETVGGLLVLACQSRVGTTEGVAIARTCGAENSKQNPEPPNP